MTYLTSWTIDQQSLLTAAYQRAGALQIASEALTAASKVQRDLRAAALECQRIIATEPPGEGPGAAAVFARNQTYLSTDMARFTPERLVLIKAACQAVYGYPPEETDMVYAALNDAVSVLLGATAETVEGIAGEIVAAFLAPPSLWT